MKLIRVEAGKTCHRPRPLAFLMVINLKPTLQETMSDPRSAYSYDGKLLTLTPTPANQYLSIHHITPISLPLYRHL